MELPVRGATLSLSQLILSCFVLFSLTRESFLPCCLAGLVYHVSGNISWGQASRPYAWASCPDPVASLPDLGGTPWTASHEFPFQWYWWLTSWVERNTSLKRFHLQSMRSQSGMQQSEEHFSLSLPSLQGEYSWSPSCNLEEVKGYPSCLCRPHFLHKDMDFLSNEASLFSGVHFLL